MATYQILRGATTYNISAGQPIFLADVDDLGGAGVRNQEESGPFQDGASHLGERLEPRTFTLRLNVKASTAAALDGYRDTLNAMFKPIRGVPITLKITRDDGEIRQLDCRRTGPLGIPLRPENIGILYRAAVMLRAADPTWYDPDEDEISFSVAADWWLAYNTIGTADVLNYVTIPGNRNIIDITPLTAGSARTIAIRTSHPGADGKFVYDAGQNEIKSSGATQIRAVLASGTAGTAIFTPPAGTSNFFFVGGTGVLNNVNVYVNDSATPAVTASGTTFLLVDGAWRGNEGGSSANDWVPEVPFAALYKIALSSLQRLALNQSFESGGSALTSPVVYEGDWDSYPVIEITGAFGDPIITNVATGDVLDFTGGTVGSSDVWTIDTRYGRKSVLNAAGSSVANYLSDESDLATFRLVPDPIAAGGTNLITVAGSAGSASAVVVSWFNRFMGY